MSIQRADSAELKDQVIRVWMIVYDQDADTVYTFFNWQKVLKSIEGSLRVFFDDNNADIIIDQILDTLQGLDHKPFVPISLGLESRQLCISIYSWEIDYATSLHRVLSKCYEQVDDTLKLEIMDVFSNSRR